MMFDRPCCYLYFSYCVMLIWSGRCYCIVSCRRKEVEDVCVRLRGKFKFCWDVSRLINDCKDERLCYYWNGCTLLLYIYEYRYIFSLSFIAILLYYPVNFNMKFANTNCRIHSMPMNWETKKRLLMWCTVELGSYPIKSWLLAACLHFLLIFFAILEYMLTCC